MGIDAERAESDGSIMWQARLRKIAGYAGVILAAGICYGVFVQRTGLAIPCLFHLVTGLQCLGCGVTRMCVALLRLDFETAFYSNRALFLLLPVLGTVFLTYIADYVKNGKWNMNRVQSGIIYACIVIMVIFGVIRNILPL